MLIGSGVRNGGGPHRMLGGAGIQSAERAQWGQTGALRNLAGEARVAGISNREGRPVGARHPVAWVMPQKSGSLASYGEADATAAMSGTVAGGVNIVAEMPGTGALSPSLLLIGYLTGALAGLGAVQPTMTALGQALATVEGVGDSDASLTAAIDAVVTIIGSGAVSSADARAILEALATLQGDSASVGSIAGVATLQSVLEGAGVVDADGLLVVSAVAALSGSSSEDMTIGALAFLVAGLSSLGMVVAGELLAIGTMAADIALGGGASTPGELSPAEIAAAVWDAQTIDLDTAGSIGERLRDAATPALVGAQMAAVMNSVP